MDGSRLVMRQIFVGQMWIVPVTPIITFHCEYFNPHSTSLLRRYCSLTVEGVFDVRQHSLLHSVPAHHGPITSIIVNDTEKYFVTGSSDGVIKVCYYSLPIHSF